MKNKIILSCVVLGFFFICNLQNLNAQNNDSFEAFKGSVLDSATKVPLIFSDIVVNGSNISTITNNEGEFVLKIPNNLLTETLIISHLGYQTTQIKISDLENQQTILLAPAVTTLAEVNIFNSKYENDAKGLFLAMLKKKSDLYSNGNTLMTGFYRETIKKRRRNASLSEAVVQIHKQPYTNLKRDAIELVKARKNTNYSRLDTIAIKLQGGPFSNLYTDIIKYPEFIFTKEDILLYDFSFDTPIQSNQNMVYVVNFKQKPNIYTPLYYGKLYIDSKSLALTNAVYSLNVENRELSSQMYVRKKPRKVDVYPTEASYRVNYRTKNGKWHYAYSNISLTFKVNWKGKLFNSVYTLNSEMAITDWKPIDTRIAKTRGNMLRPTTILTDKVSGFSDPEFWGEYNIIEPEKSIESAIKKIQKQLKRT
ncbi:carboxypeptidase-like regulatory domain-containing protein [Changchengzhania lutea]|uniref:carboxypeptidase-like regulatory domain-containing protein n=1 Tax=Changchengzhania lutea TaxID=2049305 RepID=UPI00115ECBB2|nr:carboxypeptidase-like regulatory domain-containing protein [Changchengzhania lutea]